MVRKILDIPKTILNFSIILNFLIIFLNSIGAINVHSDTMVHRALTIYIGYLTGK